MILKSPGSWKKFHCTVGAAGTKMLAQLTVDKAFMGTNSLSISKGASTPDIQQAEIKKAMIASAKKVILLCSNRKLGKDSFAHFASLDRIDTLIIDQIDDNEKFEFLNSFHTGMKYSKKTPR